MLDETKIAGVAEMVCAVLNEYYDRAVGYGFEQNSIFNDNDIIAGEDVELIFEAIAAKLSIDTESFFTEIPIRHYLEKDYGLVALPLLPLAPFFQHRRKDKGEIRRITVLQFSQNVVAKFPELRFDE